LEIQKTPKQPISELYRLSILHAMKGTLPDGVAIWILCQAHRDGIDIWAVAEEYDRQRGAND
jgi:hypothetical protein